MAKATKPEFVRIQSTMNIRVTSGLDYEDFTNRDSDIPDRLKISSEWNKFVVEIKQGAHLYPSEIIEWDTVKSLVKDKVLTIGEFTDSYDNEDPKIMEIKQDLKERSKAKNLSEIAGE